MANPIQRLVRLVLDRAAASKMERDSKKSLGRVEQGFAKIKKAALALGGALAAAFGIRAIARFGKESVRIASEATAIWGRLEQAVQNAGVSFAGVRGEINAAARAMQDATVVGDEDFAAVLAELITTSNDYEESLRNVSVVADLAAAKNMDLRSAAQLVGRAMVGQTSTLTRYGIVIKEGEDAMEVLRHQFRGFAENEGATFQGTIRRLSNEWDDFRQAVGDAMIAAGGGTSVLETVIATLKTMTRWTNENRQAIASWGNVIFRTLRAVGETFLFLGRMVKSSFEVLGTSLALLANDLTQTWARTINVIISGLNKIPGVNIDFRLNELTPEEFATQQALLTEQIAENAGDMKNALLDLAASYREVGKAALDAAQAQGQQPDAPRRDGGGSGGGFSIPDVPVRIVPQLAGGTDFALKQFENLRLSLPNEVMRDFADQMKMARDMTALTGESYDTLDDQVAMLTGTMQRLLELGLSPADKRMQALAGRLREIQDESALVTRQHEIMASVAESTGEVLNAAFGAGIGALAANKAKQNAIMAAEQLAMALVASLNPFTAPKAAGHYAAAAQFSGIAAAWGALAGATGGFSSARGGGVGGFQQGRGDASRRAGSLSEAGPELNVYFVGEGFDAVNPRVQRVVQGALQEAQSSAGPNARVRIYRDSKLVQEGG